MSTKTDEKTVYEKSARFAESLFRDFREGELPQALSRDLKESYDFYLDEPTRRSLQQKPTVSRWFLSTWLLVKNLFLKLTPARRLILLIGVVLAVDGSGGDTGNLMLGFLTLLFILGLELKDKLLAKDELAAGRAVQVALMPERQPVCFPEWDVWLYTEPANDVGGDLVDCQIVDDDRYSVSLGDVSGKGLGAALFMAKLQATVRAISPGVRSLAELGARVNDISCRDGVKGRFASMIYAELSSEDASVRMFNAGHMPPLLIRSGGITELDKGGPAFGLAPKSRYKESEVALEGGDVLVLYSDGVTEARDSGGAFFGDDRLSRLLDGAHGRSARDIGERILESVALFVGGAAPSDDLSVAIITRRRSRPALPAHTRQLED